MVDTLIGTIDGIELSHGSFGQQYTTIDWRRFVTWFDYLDPALEGLRPGCRVEYRAEPAPTILCHAPRVTEALPRATLLRVIAPGTEGLGTQIKKPIRRETSHVNIIEMEPAPPPARTKQPQGLLLHCGGRVVSRDELLGVPTPVGTETWFPLDHGAILEEVEGQLSATGFTIEGERHGLSHAGARYFGVLSVSLPGRIEEEYQWVVGLRNSHDMTYPAGLVAGTHVLVCSNLAFCGEVKISRKHTRFALRDLRHLVARAVGQLGDRFRSLDARVAAYREARVPDWLAHDVVVRAADCSAITVSQIPDVLKQWRQPEHEAFRPRNAWSLFNAFTAVYREVNPHTALRRGEALHGLFDAVVGMS